MLERKYLRAELRGTNKREFRHTSQPLQRYHWSDILSNAFSNSLLRLFFYGFKQHHQFRLGNVTFLKQESQTTKFTPVIH